MLKYALLILWGSNGTNLVAKDIDTTQRGGGQNLRRPITHLLQETVPTSYLPRLNAAKSWIFSLPKSHSLRTTISFTLSLTFCDRPFTFHIVIRLSVVVAPPSFESRSFYSCPDSPIAHTEYEDCQKTHEDFFSPGSDCDGMSYILLCYQDYCSGQTRDKSSNGRGSCPTSAGDQKEFIAPNTIDI